MKLLYVIYACNDISYVCFQAVTVEGENEKEYSVLEKIKIESYEHTFPKDKINKEFKFGYVTEELDKNILKSQLYRVYNNLKEKHLKSEDKSLQYGNDQFYKGYIKAIEKCITVQEYEKNNNS